MKCWKCGEAILAGKMFCTSCGASQEKGAGGKKSKAVQTVVFLVLIVGGAAAAIFGLNQYMTTKAIRGHDSKGRQLLNAAQWQSAYSEFKFVYEKLPEDARSRISAARALTELQEYDKSIKLLEKAVSLEPNNLEAHIALGLNYMKKGQFDKSEAQLLKAKAINERSPDVYARLGQLYKEMGDAEKAIEAFEASKKYRGGKISFDTLIVMGEMYRERKAYQDSVDAFDNAIKRNQESYEAHLGKAKTLFEMANYADALAEIEAAVRMNSSLEEARQVRQTITETRQRVMQDAYLKERKPMEDEFFKLLEMLVSINGKFIESREGTNDDLKRVAEEYQAESSALLNRAIKVYADSEDLTPPGDLLQSKQAFRNSIKLVRDAYQALETAIQSSSESAWKRYAQSMQRIDKEMEDWILQWAESENGKSIGEAENILEKIPSGEAGELSGAEASDGAGEPSGSDGSDATDKSEE